MNPSMDEPNTRQVIDNKLSEAGWVIQDTNRLNLTVGIGVAVREMATSTGPADYMLFVDGRACGIIEAKREGASLESAAEQSQRYATSELKHINRSVPLDQPLPFLYEATNNVIRFRDERDPRPRSREIFHFHQPQTLKAWLDEGDTLRQRLQILPLLDEQGLWECQIDAIHGIEQSLLDARPRALLQMATGAGKTFTAVNQVYRLARHASVRHVLFLVDRGNLAKGAHTEFDQFEVPGDGRKFSELYNVNILGPAGLTDATKVTISTIQRLYAQLTGGELDEAAEEQSGFEVEASIRGQGSRPVSYNPAFPIEAFDVIIVDECHRSIYNLWSQVLDYFDAFLIGLTATPTRQTIGFFHQNLVAEYPHEQAVVDQVNVGYDIYRIKTQLTEQGNTIEADTQVEFRDRLTKERRLEVLDEEETWEARKLDRSVLAPNQIRMVMRTFHDQCLPACFPNRMWQGNKMEWVPKTLVFAKNDDHCDQIVDAVREVFGEGNEFCRKITYRVGKRDAEESLTAFRTDPKYRIAVTVDMIATGTDIRPLECLVFMRDVKSQAYYEQMKGRGTRVIDADELRLVTPDAQGKSRFVLVDCVGVTETDKTETRSMERRPSVPTAKLMDQVARGDRHPDTLRTLGNRLIRINMGLNEQQKALVSDLIKKTLADQEHQAAPSHQADEGIAGMIDATAGEAAVTPTDAEAAGQADDIDNSVDSAARPDSQVPLQDDSLKGLAASLIHATNEDKLISAAQQETGKEEVTEEEIQRTFKPEADDIVRPIHNPDLRETIERLRRSTEQLIDESPDEVLPGTGFDEEKAEGLITNWQKFITDHKDEIDAIQLIYQQPYHRRHLSYDTINQLVEAIDQPPYDLAPVEVWKAYEHLQRANVRGAPPETKLPLLISLIRLSIGVSDVLEPFNEVVNQRFEVWLRQHGVMAGQGAGLHGRDQVEDTEPSDYHGADDNLDSGNSHGASDHQGADDGDSQARTGQIGNDEINQPQTEQDGAGQENNVREFTKDQVEWLYLIRDQIALNAEMTLDVFDLVPFNQKGGLLKAQELFGADLEPLIDELNGYLIA